nr:hypothetical protein [Lysobacter enzymogenes]
MQAAASAIEPNISRRREICCDSAPAAKIANASAAVLSDNASEAEAGLRRKSQANSGSNGCTQYSSEKVEQPARNRARLARR